MDDLGCMALSDTGNLIALAGDNGFQLWNMTSGALRRYLAESVRHIEDIMFSPDGVLIAYASDSIVYLNSIEILPEFVEKVLYLPRSPMLNDQKLTFSRNGRRLATADRNKVVIWDVKSATMLQTLKFNLESYIGVEPGIIIAPNTGILDIDNTTIDFIPHSEKPRLYVGPQWLHFGTRALLWLSFDLQETRKISILNKENGGKQGGLIAILQHDSDKVSLVEIADL